MLQRLYDWTMDRAQHRNADWALGGISFAEATFFPVPADVLLIPMVMSNRDAAWRLALICTVTSVVGGMVGYFLGWALYETVGRAIIQFYGLTDEFHEFQELYRQWGAWIVMAGGLTPIPYKVVTIASGVAELNLFEFFWASLVSRAVRFYLVAGLLWYFGPPVRRLIEKNLGLALALFLVILIGGFVLVEFLL